MLARCKTVTPTPKIIQVVVYRGTFMTQHRFSAKTREAACLPKRSRSRQRLAIGLVLLLGAATGHTTEGGGGHYPNGAEDFMAGALPPPGQYFLNYLSYYTADQFKDDQGDELIPDFDLKVPANTFRFIYVSPYQFLGASWAMHIFVPFASVDVKLPPGRDDRSGLGDIIVDPFILGWHSKNWHFITALDIFVPTGLYTKDRFANVGRNYWTFEPIFAFTYLSDGGFEVSSKLMYDFNTENSATNYRSGQEFHADYTVGLHLNQWSLGVGGYYYRQTTSDEINGDKVQPDGFKGRAFAIGPEAKYDYKNLSFTLKYQKEMDVENRPEGDAFWFKFLYAF